MSKEIHQRAIDIFDSFGVTWPGGNGEGGSSGEGGEGANTDLFAYTDPNGNWIKVGNQAEFYPNAEVTEEDNFPSMEMHAYGVNNDNTSIMSTWPEQGYDSEDRTSVISEWVDSFRDEDDNILINGTQINGDGVHARKETDGSVSFIKVSGTEITFSHDGHGNTLSTGENGELYFNEERISHEPLGNIVPDSISSENVHLALQALINDLIEKGYMASSR